MFNLLIVVFGFGMIIFIHEAGHFLAARWAGIRVLAFAVGFGPALLSWRKGMGLQRGSSERHFEKLKAQANSKRGDAIEDVKEEARRQLVGVSPTEYRLNVLPFGGYVKMLGQEDADPTATSNEPDSYQNCKVWKRMVVISAGVVMNMVSAAILFVIVFSIGLETPPAKIGSVRPGSPAANTMASNAASLGVTRPGFMPGDEVISIDGHAPNSFNDVVLASAMAKRDRAINIIIKRLGVAQPLDFSVVPSESRVTGLLELGLGPASTTQLLPMPEKMMRTDAGQKMLKSLADQMALIGLEDVEPGMTLTHVNDQPIEYIQELSDVVRASGGAPVHLRFTNGKEVVEGTIKPRPELEQDNVKAATGELYSQDHLLGLTGVIIAAWVEEESRGDRQGLKSKDVFERVGGIEFPSLTSGMIEIRANKRKKLPVAVQRKIEGSDAGERETVQLQPNVSRKGIIGFTAGDTTFKSTLLAMPETALISGVGDTENTYEPAAVRLIDVPGTTIDQVAGSEVGNLGEVRVALADATRDAYESGAESATVEMTLRLPFGDDGGEVVTKSWTLTRDELSRLHALTWTSPLGAIAFAPEEFLLKGSSPVDSLGKGLDETRRVMLSTYTTFARLFEGTVKVQHLKGPVGIAHLGTLMADKGMIWLLFLAAIVSVNLAVINFMPLPIVDGGQFLFLLFEGVRGKPVPVGIQNAFALAGIVLIGAVFIIVTFNDIVGLFGGM